jgi:beta-lactamase regulating signal transducer with metallopeptidase domain
MLAGIFRPVLLLPPEPMSPEALRCSLLHELTHFRRQDIPLKALGLWVTAVHWFHPAVWLMRRLLEQDTELACDEEALGRLSREERAVYGQTILAAAARLKGDASA